MIAFSKMDQKRLDAVEGWLGLEDHLSANEEWEQISAELSAHPKMLLLRMQIFLMAKKWEACIEIAVLVIKTSPKIADGWIGRSEALHGLNRSQEALHYLLTAREMFPNNWIIPFHLARYHFHIHRIEEAGGFFRMAMMLNRAAVERKVIDDPSLKTLWNSKPAYLEPEFWPKSH